MRKTIKIEGMSCAHCKASVEHALAGLAEVEEVHVDLENKCAVVNVLDSTTNEILQTAIEDQGYQVISIE